MDAKGTIIKVLDNQVKEPGYYTIKMNTSHLPHGVYFCRTILGKQTQAFKIIK